MSTPDYYKILQVPVTATSAEIKAAYRRLAKIYHPDKNYAGYSDEETFKQIKEAYETLINPQRRARYDAKRNRATTFSSTNSQAKAQKKNYNFSEEEAKRRQYYQQHYKKPNTNSSKSKQEPPVPKQSSELKYILISVPVAVALLLLMIRIYEQPLQKEPLVPVSDSILHSEINTPESPYKGVFGKTAYDTTSLSVIKLVNRSGHDAIVFLENDSQKVVRHHFIENNYELLAENLPASSYRVYYWLGDNFSYKQFLFSRFMGDFRTTLDVDSAKERIDIKPTARDTFGILLENGAKKDTLLLRKIFSH